LVLTVSPSSRHQHQYRLASHLYLLFFFPLSYLFLSCVTSHTFSGVFIKTNSLVKVSTRLGSFMLLHFTISLSALLASNSVSPHMRHELCKSFKQTLTSISPHPRHGCVTYQQASTSISPHLRHGLCKPYQ
jgi:hypothetical protein